jgi:hypothetical protein
VRCSGLLLQLLDERCHPLLLLLCRTMEEHHSTTGTAFGYIRSPPHNQERKEELPKAVDLSHHLSELAKNRQPSPLKSFYKYWRKPGVIGLGGGMEHCREIVEW